VTGVPDPPRLELSDPLPGLRQLGPRIGQLTAQRYHQRRKHLRRRRLLLGGHPWTLPGHDHPPRESSRRRCGGSAATPRLLPARPGPGHDQQTVTASLPLLLLDVDGVLNPFAAPACPSGYTEHDIFRGEEPVRLCPAHGPWLAELATRFQIVWATAWGADASRLLGPLLRLPDLPVIAFPPVPFRPRDKLPAIIRYAGHRPLAWMDDALPPEAQAWAACRRTPTLPKSGVDPCLSAAQRAAGSRSILTRSASRQRRPRPAPAHQGSLTNPGT